MGYRIDLSKVKRPAKQLITRTFHDPLQPDTPLPITLESPVYFSEAAAIALAAREMQEHWSDPETGLSRFPPVDGLLIEMNEITALAFAALERLQPQPPAYGLFDLAELSVKFPNAFVEAASWAQSLIPGADPVKGGSSRAMSGGASSAPPSMPNTSIPSAASASTPPSAPSMNGSDTSAAPPPASSSEEKEQRFLATTLMHSPGTG